MCGAYGFSGGFGKNENLGYERFSIVNRLSDVHPRFNARPEQTLPVVVSHSPNSLVPMRWGFPVPWMTKAVINAKAETLAQKDLFKAPLTHGGRCLVIASFFYEWDKRVVPSQPYLFQRRDHALFAFAGLYREYKDQTNGTPILRFVIITTTPNSLVKPVHDRMPVMLKKEDEATWLNPDIVEPEKLLPLLAFYPAQDMESYPVSRAVGKNTNDYPELIKPLGKP